MIKEILVYLAVVLFTLYWFFMFNENVMAFMLVLEVIYFFSAVIFSVTAKSKISISINNLMHTGEQNQNIPIKIAVKNQCKIFPIHFCLYLKIENMLTGEKTRFKTKGTVRRKNNKTLIIPISAQNCGNMMITIKKVKIYDLLMIMGSIKRIKESTQVSILPQMHLIPVEITRKTRGFIADADEYSDRESGDDSSEIYQIREYTKEDSMHDIHWKLSAKSDTLLVKERGKSLGSVVLIWIDTFENSNKRRWWMKSVQRKLFRTNSHLTNGIAPKVLEIAASVSFSLFEEKCVHMVAWYEPENGVVRKKRISREIHIYELLNRLTLIQPCAEEEKIRTVYRNSFRGEHFSSIVEIKSNGEMTVNGEPIQVPAKKGNIQWEQLGITV
ncbi:MAG: DUF58 domain-containing protein [Eubacterium sp.]